MARGNLQVVKTYLGTNEMKSRFAGILGKKAPQFMASIVNAVSMNQRLQECDAKSVISAALVAATLDLPIDGNLGFAAIVPYKGKAQFQVMYKGFIQLAIRSGYYERMNYSEVYEDEFVSYNPITGEIEFTDDFSKCKQRSAGQSDKIVGYYAWFKLKTGFSQSLFMSRADMENHARAYSMSYRSDLKKGTNSSLWTTNFNVMAKKTVIKQLLSRWGILSVEMQRAIQSDQKVYEGDGKSTYADNQPDEPAADDVVDAFAQEVPEQVEDKEQTAEPQGQEEPEQKAEPEKSRGRKPQKVQPEPEPEPQQDFMEFDSQFDEDEMDELPFK